jgi:uncharacterized protein
MNHELSEGVARFNAGRFWDAHESWEEIWLGAEPPERTFLQGMIQLAAAYHHFQRGTLPGGVRLVEAAIEKLQPFPEGYMGIERGSAIEAASRHGEWAREALEAGTMALLPPREFPNLTTKTPPRTTPHELMNP